MRRNVELLERTMLHILDHPEKHDQSIWVSECGTAGCLAGWACLLSGWTVGFVDNILAREKATVLSPHDGYAYSLPWVAAELLGLTGDEAAALFHPENTIAELQLMVKDLVNGDELRDREDYLSEVS